MEDAIVAILLVILSILTGVALKGRQDSKPDEYEMDEINEEEDEASEEYRDDPDDLADAYDDAVDEL